MQPGSAVTLAEFHEWYDKEHVPIRIERFGAFRSAARYCVTSSRYFSHDLCARVADVRWAALYTVSSTITFSDRSYVALRSQRSQREAELFSRLSVIDRRIYKLEYDSDWDATITTPRIKIGLSAQKSKDTGGYLVADSVDVNAERQQDYNVWFDKVHVPMLSRLRGWKRSRRFILIDSSVTGKDAKDADAKGIPPTLGLHEYEEEGIQETEEYKQACRAGWSESVAANSDENILRGERKTCTLYKAWDPIAALQEEKQCM
ncbi:hypothetical protein NDA18_001464 [Ustilago nuda]|nr:hypothetical protein NDA18_001464 [Ustilago nuda]